ncbi:phosphoribosylaminoimidazolesuccinocarboxamide synthase [Candidatus Acetothermia bacterium]|nr:phosphoribosylaminoimidazolesuccinocarboxamide synthase [Candidatus Acetothermia bacterium]
MQLLYEGKAKKLLSSPEPGMVVVQFKDSVTAGNAAKKAEISGKGALASAISIKLLELVSAKGVPTHFVKKMDERSFLARQVEIIPLEIVVRNWAAGSIVKRLGLERGKIFEPPLVEFFYKSDSLGDPLIGESHIQALGLATPEEVERIKQLASKANSVLKEYFLAKHLKLIDLKFEFGRARKNHKEILLADEISPDTMRLWDDQTNESLDKDVFREDKGDLLTAYRAVAQRMGLI